jgi:hypothetical protein
VPQNRVDWSDPRISPAVYEDMVAVLISRLHTEAQRIDGSGGDGGRDVQLPLPSGLEIFELKSFTGRMTSARRRQVQKSLKKAARHSPRAWHLVVPINHTPTELEWFENAIRDYSFPCDWRDRDWLDGNIANHPELPRYYIEGSSDEIVAVLRELNQEQAYLAAGLPDAVERITALTARLNELDPHYMFVFSASPVDGVKVTILPRYPGAEKDRPIRISAAFNFPNTAEGHAAAAALSETVAYGAPGTVSGEFVSSVAVEGISGLDSAFTTAQLAFGPAQIPPGASAPEISLRLVDKHGVPVTQLPLKLVTRNVGTHGGDLALTDYSGAVSVTTRLDMPTHRFTLNYRFSAPETVLPGAMLPALQFLSGIHTGHSVVMLINGEPAGPPVSEPQSLPDELVGYTQLATDLDEIQRESGVYFPMPKSLSYEEQENILIAKQLLSGQVVSAEWTSSRMTMPAKSLEGLKELSSGEVRQLWARLPYTLSLEGRYYPLGYILRTHATARIEDWPQLSADTQPDTEIEVTILPGSDNTLTIKLLSIDELDAPQSL